MPSMKLGDTALIVAECKSQKLARNEAANVLAQIFWESGGTMKPVRETFAKSDAAAKAALTKAWKAGKLSWVKADYWSGGWFGRGHIQLTHYANYLKAGTALGIDLISDPAKAMEPAVSAAIAVRGMREGWFTGKKLSDYFSGSRADHAGARAIVNGDKNKKPKGEKRTIGKIIADLAGEYDLALRIAGYDAPAKPTPEPAAPNAMLKRGDTGKYVEDLQRNLIALGYSLTVTGTFDDRTEAAVEAFQSKHGLLVDGKAGIRTNTKIGEEIAAMVLEPKIDEAKKNIPPTADKAVKEEAGWFSKIGAWFTGGGLLTAFGLGNWSDAEWTTILAMAGGVVLVGGAAVGGFLLLGNRVAAKFDEINARAKG